MNIFTSNGKFVTFQLNPGYQNSKKIFDVNMDKESSYDFTLFVLIPRREYIGQELIKLVSTNTPAMIISTIPKVPEITFEKYRITTTTASKIRMILSAEPMFFFMMFFLDYNILKIVCTKIHIWK